VETKLSFSKYVILLPSITSTCTFVGRIEGIISKLETEQSTFNPTSLHLHPSGHSVTALVCWNTNQNQNITAGEANSSDTNTTVSLDAMAIRSNLHRERNCI
jgi:hypothetical protein